MLDTTPCDVTNLTLFSMLNISFNQLWNWCHIKLLNFSRLLGSYTILGTYPMTFDICVWCIWEVQLCSRNLQEIVRNFSVQRQNADESSSKVVEQVSWNIYSLLFSQYIINYIIFLQLQQWLSLLRFICFLLHDL